jgi:two-component system response regulator MprA
VAGAARTRAPDRHHGDLPQRIMVADGDRAIRESLARALELESYEVVGVAVGDGVEALMRVRRETFDALAPDGTMPGVEGTAVCRVLRADCDRRS